MKLFRKPDPCQDAERLIQQSLDAPLGAAERRRLDRHLATCDGCRQAWDEYRQLSRTADKWVGAATVDPGDEFTRRVMMELGLPATESATLPQLAPPRRGRSISPWGLGAAAVVIVALTVAGMFVPPVAHSEAALNAYVASLHAPSMLVWRVDTLLPFAIDRLDFGDLLSPLRSWAWPLYAFAGALVANVAFAGATVRQRRITSQAPHPPRGRGRAA